MIGSNLLYILSPCLFLNSREHMTGLSNAKNHVVLINIGEHRIGSNMSYISPKMEKYLSYILHPHILSNSRKHLKKI